MGNGAAGFEANISELILQCLFLPEILKGNFLKKGYLYLFNYNIRNSSKMHQKTCIQKIIWDISGLVFYGVKWPSYIELIYCYIVLCLFPGANP